jgi:hypothetical protein
MSTERDVTAGDGWFVGEDKSFVFLVHDAVGAVANVTSWTITWRLSNEKYGAPILTKTAIITDGPNGVATVLVNSADTIAMIPGTYYYDARRIDTGARAELAYGSAVLLDTWTDP